MNTHSHYRVRSLPTKPQNFLLTMFKRKKTKVIASIIGFYIVVSGGVGMLLFKPNSEVAQASNIPVAVAANFELNNIDAILQNNLIDGNLTLTNQSLTEDLTNVSLDLYSTKESVGWTQINYQDSAELIKPNAPTTFSLLPIKKNSTIILNVKGILKNKSLPNVGLMAKIIFDSNQGQLETTSNRILLKLGEGGSKVGALPNLKTDKLEYLAKEKVFFSLENFSSENKNKIKMSISNKNTGELMANTLECQSDIEGQCLISYDKLETGKYGAIFFDKDKNPASQIVDFEIKNPAGASSGTDFRANPNSALELPFGSGSVNGQIAVLAQNVVDVGKTVTSTDKCSFQILQNGSVLQQFQTSIVNKKCYSNLEINGGAGIYQLKLVGSPIEKSFSFLPKSKNSVAIQKVAGGEKSQALKLKLGGIQQNVKKTTSNSSSVSSNGDTGVTSTQSTNNNSNKITAKISVHSIESGIVQEISTLNNSAIALSNAEETIEIPSNNFDLDGNYQVFATLDNGQQSDFLNLEISDKNFGFAQSGISVKSGTELKLGQKNTFEIKGLNYRNGKPVQSGTCENNITQEDGSKITANGEIKDGNCEFSVENLKKSGSILVSNSKFNLTSQFTFKSGTATNFGDINISNFPIFPNNTNKIIAGPFTDEFDNPANQKGYIVHIESGSKSITDLPMDIFQGFGEVVIPSSLINGEEISFKLLDGDKEIASKTYEVSVEDELVVPLIPSQIKEEERVRALFYTNIMNPTEKCSLKVISIGQKTIEQEVNPVVENKSCTLDWGATDGKLSQRNLVQFKVGNSNYTYVINSEGSKAAQTFELNSSITDNGNGTVNLELLTSTIKDANNLPIQSGELEWTFGNKKKNTTIQNGLASLSLTLSDIESKNLKKEGEGNYLSLEVDAKASEISLSKTARLNLNLGKNTLSDKSSDFVPILAQNIVSNNSSNIWKFRTGACNVTTNEAPIKSYFEKDVCYVQVNSKENTKEKLVFKNGNTNQGFFEFQSSDSTSLTGVCEKSEERCEIFVTDNMTNFAVSTITKDGESQIGSSNADASLFAPYKEDVFPTEKYPIKISYDIESGEKVVFYRELSGKALAGK